MHVRHNNKYVSIVSSTILCWCHPTKIIFKEKYVRIITHYVNVRHNNKYVSVFHQQSDIGDIPLK